MSRQPIGSASHAQSNTERDTADQTVHELIAVRAYELFQSRGAIHGADIDDWLQAEKEFYSSVRSLNGDYRFELGD